MKGLSLLAEKPKVHSGKSPPRIKGPHQRLVVGMGRGDWVVVSHAQAKGLAAAAQALGGRATRYQVDGASSCVKVLEAPWKRPPKGPSVTE